MKLLKVFLITAFFSTSLVLAANSAKAASGCGSFNPSPPTGSLCCSTSQCGNASLGDYLYLRVYAKDENGNIVVGPVANYNWQVVSPQTGVFDGPPTPASTTWSDSTSNGQSVARLKVSPTADTVADKRVMATVVYGGYSRNYIFNILATCQSVPNLYYGVAGVSKQGDGKYNYSTAEVLSSCYDEYRLYEGDGSK